MSVVSSFLGVIVKAVVMELRSEGQVGLARLGSVLGILSTKVSDK